MTKRFVPCYVCKGSGRFLIDSIPDAGDVTEACAGCGGTGSMSDYVRLKAEREQRDKHDSTFVCTCGHNAMDHYDNYDRCAFEWDAGGIWYCECRKSRQAVVAEGRHSLIEVTA